MVNIFNEAKEVVKPTWGRFTNAGDSFQGTYIGMIENVKDNFDHLQTVYQLLQDDGSVINVGFGLNKKVLHKDMESVDFGQIIGFKYKGKLTVKDKRTGKMVEVNDFALHQDKKIVDDKWLAENKDNMPKKMTTSVDESPVVPQKSYPADTADMPFSSGTSLTNDDKVAVIEKLAKEKLGATDLNSAKVLVMEKLGIAFIPLNFDLITENLVNM